MKELVLLGNGWGFKALYKGLKDSKWKISLLTDDLELLKVSKDEHVLINSLENLEGKILICAGYAPIIKKEVLERNIIINIHYSLLPKYRGLHSTVWALLNNERYLGLTVHLMNESIDDGDIIHQYSIENKEEYTSRDFMELFNKYVEENIEWIINEYFTERIQLRKQNKKEATWVGKRNLEDCRINFTHDISQIKRFFRALVSPYPLPFLTYKGVDYEILKIDFHETNCETNLGRVLNIDPDGVYIKIKDGYIIIKELKSRENGEILIANQVIKSLGYRFI